MAAEQDRKARPAGREDRLAAALRENLKRRKAQARLRDETRREAAPTPNRAERER